MIGIFRQVNEAKIALVLISNDTSEVGTESTQHELAEVKQFSRKSNLLSSYDVRISFLCKVE